eukprot:1474012-Prymnesium_polylepis.1
MHSTARGASEPLTCATRIRSSNRSFEHAFRTAEPGREPERQLPGLPAKYRTRNRCMIRTAIERLPAKFR